MGSGFTRSRASGALRWVSILSKLRSCSGILLNYVAHRGICKRHSHAVDPLSVQGFALMNLLVLLMLNGSGNEQAIRSRYVINLAPLVMLPF